VHVTVTDPAASVAALSKVMVMTLLAYVEVTVGVVGEVTPHRLMFCALMTPFGNVRVILLLAAAVNADEVEKVTVTTPPAPTALVIPLTADKALAVTAPTAGTLT